MRFDLKPEKRLFRYSFFFWIVYRSVIVKMSRKKKEIMLLLFIVLRRLIDFRFIADEQTFRDEESFFFFHTLGANSEREGRSI